MKQPAYFLRELPDPADIEFNRRMDEHYGYPELTYAEMLSTLPPEVVAQIKLDEQNENIKYKARMQLEIEEVKRYIAAENEK